jgi:tRNA-2-methylthio-N6-dimethylallyladenosine synthase
MIIPICFFYSERPGTLAQKRYKDDIPEDVKKRRLQEIVDKQYYLSLDSNKMDIGKTYKVLIEGDSKKVTSIGWEEIRRTK